MFFVFFRRKKQTKTKHVFPVLLVQLVFKNRKQFSETVNKQVQMSVNFSSQPCMSSYKSSNSSICFHLQSKQLEFGELEWLTEMGIFGEQVEAMAAAEVPQLPISQPSNGPSYRAAKSSTPYKKPRIEILNDEDEYFTVPDLG